MSSQRPDHSPSGVSNDYYSDGSFENNDYTHEEFMSHYTRYERESTFSPQETVGFGTSRFGPRPEELTVANTGTAAGNRLAYRQDLEPLYRFDSRRPEVIFNEGFQPHNDLRPSSLQYYQADHTETALVSTTRDPTPMEEAALPAWAYDDQGLTYRYTINAPGGYEFMTSLGPSAFANQQEVAFWKGIRPEYISEVSAIDRMGNLQWTAANPNAHEASRVMSAREQRNRAYAAAIQNPFATHLQQHQPGESQQQQFTGQQLQGQQPSGRQQYWQQPTRPTGGHGPR